MRRNNLSQNKRAGSTPIIQTPISIPWSERTRAARHTQINSHCTLIFTPNTAQTILRFTNRIPLSNNQINSKCQDLPRAEQVSFQTTKQTDTHNNGSYPVHSLVSIYCHNSKITRYPMSKSLQNPHSSPCPITLHHQISTQTAAASAVHSSWSVHAETAPHSADNIGTASPPICRGSYWSASVHWHKTGTRCRDQTQWPFWWYSQSSPGP